MLSAPSSNSASRRSSSAAISSMGILVIINGHPLKLREIKLGEFQGETPRPSPARSWRSAVFPIPTPLMKAIIKRESYFGPTAVVAIGQSLH